MKERAPSMVIFEGAQGAGKTSATNHLVENGYEKRRGIPEGPDLIKNTDKENWQQSCLILAETSQAEGKYAMDRSIVSLMAFRMRKKPENADLTYSLGSSMLSRTINGKDYCLVSINAKAEDCMQREDKASVVAIDSLGEAQKEIETYDRLMRRLKEDGLNVMSVDNIGITEEEFLSMIEEMLALKK